jgi:hypothetical protein
MARIAWRVFPDNITLSDPDNWERLDQHRYRATRYYIAIEEHRSSDAKTTPPLLTVPLVLSRFFPKRGSQLPRSLMQ